MRKYRKYVHGVFLVLRTEILGIGVDCVTNEEALKFVLDTIKENKRENKIIVTPNPEMIIGAKKDSEFSNVLKSADLVIPDGIGVVMASKLNKIKIKERVPGCDFTLSIFDKIKFREGTVYILGAGPGVAKKAKENMERKYPGLRIVGYHDGFFDEIEEKSIIKEIESLKPDVLLVGLGFPKQEKWIYRNKALPVNLSIAIGGSIDVMAGTVKRAPEIFQKLGLEWFYRLIKQPSRFFRMLAIPRFIGAVICEKIKSPFKRR